MAEAKVADTKPVAVELKAGEAVFYCTCGESGGQPFCDGSHKGTGFAPMKFEPEKDETVYMCQCKRTANAPRCDGSHQPLSS